jgi:hypothetical protein
MRTAHDSKNRTEPTDHLGKSVSKRFPKTKRLKLLARDADISPGQDESSRPVAVRTRTWPQPQSTDDLGYPSSGFEQSSEGIRAEKKEGRGAEGQNNVDHRRGNLQDREFTRFECQNREQEEADHETNGGTQITCAKDEHTVPPTHYTQSVLVSLSTLLLSGCNHINKHGDTDCFRRRNCTLITWISQAVYG